MSAAFIVPAVPELLPAPLFAPTPAAERRVIEFFTAQINNDHTRRAYFNTVRRFSAWCERHGLHQLQAVQPVHGLLPWPRGCLVGALKGKVFLVPALYQ